MVVEVARGRGWCKSLTAGGDIAIAIIITIPPHGIVWRRRRRRRNALENGLAHA